MSNQPKFDRKLYFFKNIFSLGNILKLAGHGEENPLVDSFDFDFAAFEDFDLEEKKEAKPSIFKKKGKKGKK